VIETPVRLIIDMLESLSVAAIGISDLCAVACADTVRIHSALCSR
jgi:hypothetical protein